MNIARVGAVVGGGVAAAAIGGGLGYAAGSASNDEVDDNLSAVVGPLGAVGALGGAAYASMGRDPNPYWDGLDTPGRIAAGIVGAACLGLLVGDLVGDMTH